MTGEVIAVCKSKGKGTKKRPGPSGFFKEDHGLVGDAHASPRTHRQVSLLSEESIETMRRLGIEVGPGDFAENLTVRDLDLASLSPGMRLKIGEEVVLEVTQIGKECHRGCAIFRQVGKCIMPTEGIFAKVIKGGRVRAGDPVVVLSP